MKKIYYSLIGFVCLLAFSCASAPKKQDAVIEEIPEEKPAEEEQSDDVPEISESQDDLPEEKVTEDEIPELLDFALENESDDEDSGTDDNKNDDMPLEPVSEEASDVESLNEGFDLQLPPETDESTEIETSGDNNAEEAEQAGNQNDGSDEQTENSDEETQTGENGESDEDESDDDFEEESHLMDVKDIKPSRKVSVNKFQVLDITYPGQGWIYQGCVDSAGNLDTKNQNFVFYGRKLGGKEQQFSLMARVPGKYYLHFFKSDVLTGEYIDDYLEVDVVDSRVNGQKHVSAPSYAQVVPPKATISADTIKRQKEYERLAAQMRAEEKMADLGTKKDGVSPSENSFGNSKAEDSDIKTVIQNSSTNKNGSGQKNTSSGQKNAAAVPKNSGGNGDTKVIDLDEPKETKVRNASLSSDALLLQAKKLYDGKNYAGALDSINAFFEKSSVRIDEALYLQGQILEAKSEVQNIKGAIESYDLLVRNYPASPLWNQANKRSIFLKRFYINIR